MIDITQIDWSAILPYIAVGLAAQLVDGALGMAFGVISSTLMVSVLGVPTARASAAVHLVEVFTTAASGVSHVLHRNVDWRLFARLVIPGAIGGAIGAYAITGIYKNFDGDIARPVVMAYLTGIGFYILWRSFHPTPEPRKPRLIIPLALTGGFLDASGGGGWGPVVTSNLLVQGTTPRMTIGTVNTAEFFITTVISATFIATLGAEAFTLATIGVLIGGLIAAPLGAYFAKSINPQLLMRLVGIVLTLTSIYSLYRALS